MVECSKCYKQNCESCIKEWLKGKSKKNSTCPLCREPFVKTTRINPIVLKTLNNLIFQCKSCPQQFKYSDFKSHLQKCPGKISQGCPLAGCGMSDLPLPTHLQYACNQVNLTCTICNLVAKRDSMHGHYICKELYKKEKAGDTEQIQKLLKEKA